MQREGVVSGNLHQDELWLPEHSGSDDIQVSKYAGLLGVPGRNLSPHTVEPLNVNAEMLKPLYSL